MLAQNQQVKGLGSACHMVTGGGVASNNGLANGHSDTHARGMTELSKVIDAVL